MPLINLQPSGEVDPVMTTNVQLALMHAGYSVTRAQAANVCSAALAQWGSTWSGDFHSQLQGQWCASLAMLSQLAAQLAPLIKSTST